MKIPFAAVMFALFASVVSADPLNCSLAGYKASPGLSAVIAENALVLVWDGDAGQQVRLRLAINGGTPTIQDLAVRRKAGQWATVAGNVTPDFRVVSGLRRATGQQLQPLRQLGVEITPEVIDRIKFEAFWDAPLSLEIGGTRENAIPPRNGVANQPGLPRKPEEIRRATATYRAESCEVTTNGARLEVTFPSVQLGVFEGRLQYTVFKGTNLIKQEVIAKTDEPSVAYKYEAGLRGLAIQPTSRVVWRDTANSWQDYRLGGTSNQDAVPLHEVARRYSDKNFLIMPNEEGAAGGLGGHNDLLLSHPVYWTQGRTKEQPLVETDPTYGKVYHVGSPADMMEMVRRENLLIFMPHPRSKGSTGYPDAIKDRDYFRDENYRGIGVRWGMGLDGSEQRLCEYRCQTLLDDMNNWVADLPTPPKYLQAITEVYEIGPGDDLYSNNPVNYVRLDALPKPDDSGPIINAMKRGDFFWTSGEVLIPSYRVQGTGTQRTIVADVEWTFPLEFVEVVWGDGQKTERQIIPATHLPAHGQHHFQIPFDATGKKWVRFAAWDTAGNGAMVQPVKLSGNGV